MLATCRRGWYLQAGDQCRELPLADGSQFATTRQEMLKINC